MSEKEFRGNWVECDQYLQKVVKSKDLAVEWYQALSSGWVNAEYKRLYEEYVKSTQIKIAARQSATKLKGNPLENLTRYFLHKGGFVTSIKELSAQGQWQVDGQGILNRTSLMRCFGERVCCKFGPQLYMEAKNHIDPATGEEFSAHYLRMDQHGCDVGVFFSTSGYKISRGLGIAESIYHHFLQSKFHLLFAFPSFADVISKEKAPLAIIVEAYTFAANNSFRHDKTVQKIYTKNFCHEMAKSEYKRIFGR